MEIAQKDREQWNSSILCFRVLYVPYSCSDIQVCHGIQNHSLSIGLGLLQHNGGRIRRRWRGMYWLCAITG